VKNSFHLLSAVEQVAAHLRSELAAGRWGGMMPGVDPLVAELRVSRVTVDGALRKLTKEGVLAGQGAGRRRRIVQPKNSAPLTLRIAILDYEPLKQTEQWTVNMQQNFLQEGHTAFFTEKSLTELGMEVARIRRMVEKVEADAWVVCSGSREVLDWFAARKTPTFALFGRRRDVPIAGVGPDKIPAYRLAMKRLIELGHRRIVLLVRKERRVGGPGKPELAMLDELAAHGLPSGPYNLPDWEDTPDGLRRVLDELYRVSPPTALIIGETHIFNAAKDKLTRNGILAPEHVSLICTDPDPASVWCKPSLAHIRWDTRPVIRRILRWADNVADGKIDRRQTFTKAEFVEGGTIGPVPAVSAPVRLR
jgi:DNA-binding LacI/PurR family transcriptional regulator